MAKIDDLKARALDAVVKPAHHQQTHYDSTLRERKRETMDFLQELSNMQESRRYAFAIDTIEGIYTTVDHSGYVTAGQRRAINNIRRGCGDEEI